MRYIGSAQKLEKLGGDPADEFKVVQTFEEAAEVCN